MIPVPVKACPACPFFTDHDSTCGLSSFTPRPNGYVHPGVLTAVIDHLGTRRKVENVNGLPEWCPMLVNPVMVVAVPS